MVIILFVRMRTEFIWSWYGQVVNVLVKREINVQLIQKNGEFIDKPKRQQLDTNTVQ